MPTYHHFIIILTITITPVSLLSPSDLPQKVQVPIAFFLEL